MRKTEKALALQDLGIIFAKQKNENKVKADSDT